MIIRNLTFVNKRGDLGQNDSKFAKNLDIWQNIWAMKSNLLFGHRIIWSFFKKENPNNERGV